MLLAVVFSLSPLLPPPHTHHTHTPQDQQPPLNYFRKSCTQFCRWQAFGVLPAKLIEFFNATGLCYCAHSIFFRYQRSGYGKITSTCHCHNIHVAPGSARLNSFFAFRNCILVHVSMATCLILSQHRGLEPGGKPTATVAGIHHNGAVIIVFDADSREERILGTDLVAYPPDSVNGGT